MKEVSKKLNKDLDDLFFNYDVAESQKLIEILEVGVKMAELELNLLEFEKPYWFQKKKLKSYQEQENKIKKRIKSYKQRISLERKYLDKIFKL